MSNPLATTGALHRSSPASGAAGRLAWGTWAACAALALASTVLLVFSWQTPTAAGFASKESNLAYNLTFLASPLVGAVIAARRPDNPIGWLLCLVGLFTEIGQFAWGYAFYTIIAHPGDLPGGDLMAWLSGWTYIPAFSLAGTFLFLLFPSGRLLSARWRVVVWVAVVATLMLTLSFALKPGPAVEPFTAVQNPFGVSQVAGLFEATGWVLAALAVLASASSLIVRLRRSHGAEREQIKWVAYAALLASLTFALFSLTFHLDNLVETVVSILASLTVALFPIAIGIAVLRYRLYNIDRIINRTLVYGLATASLGLLYAAAIVLLQAVFSPFIRGSALAIALSTLGVATLFQPLRNRIQVVVDRRFYRHAYDAAQTVESFSQVARAEVDLERLTRELVATVTETMQPASVSLWLRDPDRSTTLKPPPSRPRRQNGHGRAIGAATPAARLRRDSATSVTP